MRGLPASARVAGYVLAEYVLPPSLTTHGAGGPRAVGWQGVAAVAASGSSSPPTTTPRACLSPTEVSGRSLCAARRHLRLRQSPSVTDKEAAKNWGSLIIVIDPAVLGSAEEFQEKAMEMCNRVKNAERVPPSSPSSSSPPPLHLPGERGDELEETNLQRGMVSISEVVFDELVKMSNSK